VDKQVVYLTDARRAVMLRLRMIFEPQPVQDEERLIVREASVQIVRHLPFSFMPCLLESVASPVRFFERFDDHWRL